mgnify:CR=1 FL=1|tara:strand:- start:278 stop:769 length:492 start_codon:yes stop_codon:yes gene_type:complete
MSYVKISLGVFLTLSLSRFFPHPPNFTSLLALSFYVPALLGIRYIPVLIIAYIITDFFIGFHNVQVFTWGSIILIGLLSKKFIKNTLTRIAGSLFGACLFFLITNFGVWTMGSYGYSFNGFILCFTLAIPFFAYNLISTLMFSTLIEALIKIKNINLLKTYLK